MFYNQHLSVCLKISPDLWRNLVNAYGVISLVRLFPVT